MKTLLSVILIYYLTICCSCNSQKVDKHPAEKLPVLSKSDHAIDFGNDESIEFGIEEPFDVLSFYINDDKGRSSILIMKTENYYFSMVVNDAGSSKTESTIPMKLTKSEVEQRMPTMIEYYTKKYNVSVSEINKIVNLIY